MSYRAYVTESLRLRAEGKYLTRPWHEAVSPRRQEDPEKIIDNIVGRLAG